MLVQGTEIIEKGNFKRARFEDYIIAIGGKNGKYDKIIMKNMAENDHLHMTIKVLQDGKADLHLKDELTNSYESVNLLQIFKYLRIMFQDFGNFIEQFDPWRGRFARLPAVLIKPPMFEVVMKRRELIMNVKEAHVLLDSVAMITEPDYIMGYVDDWKASEQYMLFRKNGRSYRLAVLAFAKHAIKRLKESAELTDSERTLMKLDDIEDVGLFATIVRNVKRVFFFAQSFYYRIILR